MTKLLKNKPSEQRKSHHSFLARVIRFIFCWCVRHPRTSGATLVFTTAFFLVGWLVLLLLAVLCGASCVAWRHAHQASFTRIVANPARTWFRRWFLYQRSWVKIMVSCGLTSESDSRRPVPVLRRITTTCYWDVLEIGICKGQELGTYLSAAERLRHAWHGRRISVRELTPSTVSIEVMKQDPFLYETVAATPIPALTSDIDFSALVVGKTEYLKPFTVSIVGGHLCGSGSTGSGKASLEWNTLRALGPALADGTVRPIFIDPKGVELRRGLPLLLSPDDYACAELAVLELLQRLVKELDERKEVLGNEGERDFTPSPECPLTLIFVDEFAPLLKYWGRSNRDKIESALGVILTQGRALGFIVQGLIQEPTKDVFTIRDLFPRRLAWRVPTESHAEAALVEKATDRGAQPHRIPESLPGVLFALDDGASTAIRARLGYVSNADIDELLTFVAHRRQSARFTARRDQLEAEKTAA